jgi:hypothetical protein
MSVLTFTTYRSKEVLEAKKQLFAAFKAKQDTTELRKKVDDALTSETINRRSLVIEGAPTLSATTATWSKAEYTAIPGKWQRGLKKNAYALFVRTDSSGAPTPTGTLDPYTFPLGVILEYASLTAFTADNTFSVLPANVPSPLVPGTYDPLTEFRLDQGGFGSALDSDLVGPTSVFDSTTAIFGNNLTNTQIFTDVPEF